MRLVGCTREYRELGGKDVVEKRRSPCSKEVSWKGGLGWGGTDRRWRVGGMPGKAWKAETRVKKMGKWEKKVEEEEAAVADGLALSSVFELSCRLSGAMIYRSRDLSSMSL
jgi:hypothetical protein